MALIGRTPLRRCLLLAAMLALLLFVSSFWLPQDGSGSGACGPARQPCRTLPRTPRPPAADRLNALIKDCPGRTFQTRRLLLRLQASVSRDGDVLLEPYLQSWDQLLSFMESLGTMVGLFSQKVEEKILLMRELSDAAAERRRHGAYASVRSMVEAELDAGLVGFSRRTDSGCRTLLRLHRSLLWLKLLLEGLAEGPDAAGNYRTPGELGREAYRVALAPHHPWLLRQAAELVFLALPDRKYFLQLVCVENQQEASPVLRLIIHALTQVHTHTQQILSDHGLLELP